MPWIGPPIPRADPTAGRSLQNVVRQERSEDDLWSSFHNKRDFELVQWFIKAKVPMNHMDRYFKKRLGTEVSSISSAYRLLEAVDELESGMGMMSWKEVFISFSESVG